MPVSAASSTAAAQLVAVILTRNEARHITACVTALRAWTHAVVVWDSGSTDATCALAQRAGALVVRRPFDTYAGQRQAVLDSLNAEWIVFVDADERATPELAAEIRAVLAADTGRVHGYWVSRRNFIAGQETRGGGYFPDYQLRLMRRSRARYAPRAVHEIVEIDGEVGHLAAPLIHYNYRDWAHFHAKQPGYVRFEAHELIQRGIRPRPHNFVLQPLREFRRRYITLAGYQDGLHGLHLALWLAWYYGFLPYWLLLRNRV
jgi:glycosyltransferase involved in cell wall biosynthesis